MHKRSCFWKPFRSEGVKKKVRVVHFTSWKFTSHFVYILRTDLNFLIKFCNSDPSFNRNILRKLQLLIITYYLEISWNDMNLKLTLGIHSDECDFFWKCILVCKFYTVLLSNLLLRNINLIADVKVSIETRIKAANLVKKFQSAMKI